MKKLLVKILLMLVALAVIGVLSRNFIARNAVEIGVKKVTGFPLAIGAVQIGLFSSQLEVHDLKLLNPPEFEDQRFVDLPLFQLQYDLGAILHGKLHIKELVVNVKEVVMVTNAKRQTNVNTIQDKLTPGSSSTTTETTPAKKTPYQVDLMRVHVGTIVIKDFSKGQPTERKITLNRDVIFENVSESASVSALVMKAVFGQVADVAGGLIKGGSAVLKDAGQTLQKTGKGLFDNLKKVIPQQ